MPSPDRQPPDLTPGAQRPSRDPLAEASNPQWGELPAGASVALVLGQGSSSAARRRVAHGEVVAYAVRHRDYLDLQLREITTWLFGSPPEALEPLAPGYLANFRVQIEGSVRRTLRVLRESGEKGRSTIAAAEVPFQRCWNCRQKVGGERREVFCSGCGQRLSVGLHMSPPEDRPVGAPEAACPACWRVRPSDARYCPGCGHDRQINLMASHLAGQGHELRLLLTEGRQRRMRLTARLTRLRFERLDSGVDPQLVADIDRVEPARPERLDDPPSPENGCRVTLQVDDGDVRGGLAAIESGELLRASEVKRPCPACIEASRGRTPPHVLGRYCSRCGTRRRLLTHPDWPTRAQPDQGCRILRHRCGTPVRQGVDLHCSGCGQSVEGYRARSSRFSRLS